MGTYVNETVARQAREAGIKIGSCEPCASSKGSWWEVFLHDGKIIACVMAPGGYVSCGEEVSPAELHMYVDDAQAARAALDAAGAA